jgi:hypothetical protein
MDEERYGIGFRAESPGQIGCNCPRITRAQVHTILCLVFRDAEFQTYHKDCVRLNNQLFYPEDLENEESFALSMPG